VIPDVRIPVAPDIAGGTPQSYGPGL